MASAQNDFSKGSVVGNIMGMAIPMTAAQLINLLYNVVDRIYIGYIPEHATLSLTGLGVCLPVITAVMAFANLFGMGGAPLCSIERGRGNQKEAEAIMGNAFTLMVICGILLTILGIVFRRPLLYLFGASDSTYPYAESYMTIYLLGSVFVMMGLGMNAFINSQGFGRIGMQTVLLGAVANIILDPVFIFGFRMDVRGAALATIISQFLSAAWFLFSDRSILRLKRETMVLKKARVLKIVSMGMSSFAAGFTNSVVAVACNATLQTWGGDLYVGVMTVIHSVREIAENLVKGLTGGSQPVLGYNFGAGQHARVIKTLKLTIIYATCVTTFGFIVGMLFSDWVVSIFTSDAELIALSAKGLRIVVMFFPIIGFQMVTANFFQSIGMASKAIFLSLTRQMMVLLPCLIILPRFFGVAGVWYSMPISDLLASLIAGTMLVWQLRKFKAQA